MSFSFTISPATNVRFKALDTALRTEFGDILTWENEPPSPWPPYFYTHVHLWGISTRSVELVPSEDGFEVRIMACSCVEDHELALRIVELIAQMTGGAIEPESGESVTAETFRHHFDKEWVDEAVNSSATFLPKVVEHDTTQGPLTMAGPGRDFVLGKRVIAELKGPEESFVERLFTKIRQVRYFDDEEYFQATKMQLDRKDGEPAVTVAIWGEGVSYLLPNVKLLAIVSDPPIFVPAEAVWELAGANCRALDDANVLVESIEGDEWLALIERARLLSVTP